jgi:hypothetical protein
MAKPKSKSSASDKPDKGEGKSPKSSGSVNAGQGKGKSSKSGGSAKSSPVRKGKTLDKVKREILKKLDEIDESTIKDLASEIKEKDQEGKKGMSVWFAWRSR